MRAEENPGRAGSLRTSGDGPSIIATDFPSLSSMVTTRRTDFTLHSFSIQDFWRIFERSAHHDERHQAAAIDIGPAVPIAELYHHIASLYHDIAAIEQQRPLAFEDNPVIERHRLVHRRTKQILAAAVPNAVGAQPRGPERFVGWILGLIVVPGLAGRLHDPQMSALPWRLEMKR